jgi:hypothetical protein
MAQKIILDNNAATEDSYVHDAKYNRAFLNFWVPTADKKIASLHIQLSDVNAAGFQELMNIPTVSQVEIISTDLLTKNTNVFAKFTSNIERVFVRLEYPAAPEYCVDMGDEETGEPPIYCKDDIEELFEVITDGRIDMAWEVCEALGSDGHAEDQKLLADLITHARVMFSAATASGQQTPNVDLLDYITKISGIKPQLP